MSSKEPKVATLALGQEWQEDDAMALIEIRVRPWDDEGRQALRVVSEIAAVAAGMPPPTYVHFGAREGVARLQTRSIAVVQSRDGLHVALDVARPVLRARGYRVRTLLPEPEAAPQVEVPDVEA